MTEQTSRTSKRALRSYLLEGHRRFDDWVWGLTDWGHAVLYRPAVSLLREALPLWRDLTPPPKLARVFASPLIPALFEALVAWHENPSDVTAGEIATLKSFFGREYERLLFNIDELGSTPACDRAADVADAVAYLAEAAVSARSEGEAARAVVHSVQEAMGALELSEEAGRQRIRAALLPWLRSSEAIVPERRDLRRELRLQDFALRCGPDGARALRFGDWAYVPVHPFADDPDLAAIGARPEDCRSVDAYCRYRDDVCFVELVAHPRRRSPHALGFRARWNGWSPPTLNVHIGVQAPFVTRALFEKSLKAWASAPIPDELTDKLVAVSRPAVSFVGEERLRS